MKLNKFTKALEASTTEIRAIRPNLTEAQAKDIADHIRYDGERNPQGNLADVLKQEIERYFLPAACFKSKNPHRTLWLDITYYVATPPTQLLSDLEAIGWSTKNGDLMPLCELPPIHGRQEITVCGPKGSGIFGDWNDDEKRKNMAACRRVMRKHGFTGVPHWKLTLADML